MKPCCKVCVYTHTHTHIYIYIYIYIYMSCCCYNYFSVKSKFALARTAALEVFDSDTTAEEDIFHELIEASPHLTVRCPEENISDGLSEGKYITL